jgi:hypothetical protein
MTDHIRNPCENCGCETFVRVTDGEIKTALMSAVVQGWHRTFLPDVGAIVDVYVCEECSMLRLFLSGVDPDDDADNHSDDDSGGVAVDA